MRCKVLRRAGAVTLSLLTGLWLAGCSGQQQQDEELEVTQENEQYAQNEEAEGENAQAENQQGQGEYAEQGEDNQYSENGEYAEGGEYADEGNATENDLQEIIQEMNGQQATGGEYADAEALQQEIQDPAAMAPTDVGMAMNQAGMGASAPAPAYSPAPAMASQGPAIPFQPGGSPAAPGLPEMGSKMPYVVQKGDTLAKISQKIYGDMSRWQEMASLSGLANPSRIFPGDLVYYTLDESSLAFATAYESVPRQVAQVQPGDTLATIAQRVYGDHSAWRAIWRQNDNIDNPDVVPPGTVVYYVSQQAFAQHLKKVKEEFAALAKIKHQKQREHGIAMVDFQKAEQTASFNKDIAKASGFVNNNVATKAAAWV